MTPLDIVESQTHKTLPPLQDVIAESRQNLSSGEIGDVEEFITECEYK
jgi:hypothetical protein